MALGTERRDSKSDSARPRGGESGLTIVANGTRVVGDLESDGVIKIEGEVVGAVRADRQVLIARGGRVEGDVVTAEAVLGGEVSGSVLATERVEVQTGAIVNGDIVTGRLIVQEGGEVNGSVKMGSDASQAVPPAQARESTNPPVPVQT
jgi:cytoskeletal protein CcmA (bactofilin family)